ncbi:MAG: hypothetical protein H8F28_08440 [Fibrella sp.]|nr:hypothetical protein [Armatimonadota bacterium]
MNAFPIFSKAAVAARTVFGLSTLLFLMSPGAILPAQAQTSTPPVVRYTPEGTRKLIFVNNPERLEVGFTDTIPGSATFGFNYSDLADAEIGRKSILNMNLEPGSYRNAFEHVYNLTRATVPVTASNPISYGVALFNPNFTNLTVTVRGKGFTTGTTGGQPFVDLFNNPTETTITLKPFRFLWILRSDADYAGTKPINPGSFFSGVVDFDVAGGSFKVLNLAYQDFNAVFPLLEATAKPVEQPSKALAEAEYSSFVTRRYTVAAAPESRVYKGLMAYPDAPESGAGVVTNLAFSVDDTTAIGALPVTYPQYVRIDAATGVFGPSPTATVPGTGWFTHNTPLRDTATVKVVGNDMFNVLMPGYGTVYALAPSYTPNSPFSQANIGNWAVVYRDVITLTNNSTRDRNFALTLNNSSGSGSPIAYKDVAGVWQQVLVRAIPVTYYTVTVPAGTTQTIEGTFTLGCPGVGTLRHAVVVTD